MTIKVTPIKYKKRIFWEIIEGGGTALIFTILLLIFLIKGNISLSFGIIIGGLILFIVSLTIRRIKWYKNFITNIELKEKFMKVEYIERDESQLPIEFFYADTKIGFTSKGKGGANKFLVFSNETNTLSQIDQGDWTSNLFVEVFTEFKKMKQEKVTYDEKDWIKKLIL